MDKNELQTTVRTLSAKLEDLNTCNDLITKHGAALQRALGELEQLDSSADVSAKIKSVNERATLFRITSNAMINVSILVCSFVKLLDLCVKFHIYTCVLQYFRTDSFTIYKQFNSKPPCC